MTRLSLRSCYATRKAQRVWISLNQQIPADPKRTALGRKAYL